LDGVIASINKLKEEEVVKFPFCLLLKESIEPGVNTPSPSLLKGAILKGGLLFDTAKSKNGNHVRVSISRPETEERRAELNALAEYHAKGGRAADALTCKEPHREVIAQAQAPTENEAILLAVGVACQGELKLPRSSEPL
jgi:hypothetical protein